MKFLLVGLFCGANGVLNSGRPFGWDETYKWGKWDKSMDHPLSTTESENSWDKDNRCGRRNIDQRTDPTCPNVLLINTDDLAWGDVTLNNPSKLLPTPNLDHFVRKGMNFRDGHSCTARCAPSRYCLHTGRYHFRRGNYHYKPIELEYGRKILPQMFKRNGYKTYVVGKPQPVEAQMYDENGRSTDGNFVFLEGAGFWGYDHSFTSRSYCCRPGGGYFRDDKYLFPFNRWGLFFDFRREDEESVKIPWEEEEEFWKKPENFYLLTGHFKDHYGGKVVKNSYQAYWKAVGKISGGRRRRSMEGGLLVRHKRGSKDRTGKEIVRDEAKVDEHTQFYKHQTTGKVVVADFKVKQIDVTEDRSNYEFTPDKKYFAALITNLGLDPADVGLSDVEIEKHPYWATYDDAEDFRRKFLAFLRSNNIPVSSDMNSSRPKLSQEHFDSGEIMFRFHDEAMKYIDQHVKTHNPEPKTGKKDLATEGNNYPFYMYLSFRAPHRPYSHNLTEEEKEVMPYATLGKPGEQLGLFDRYLGEVLNQLKTSGVFDNTMVIFTSDNGPDQGSFNIFNKFGHMRMGMMRGKKASVYEGGHRVPFLVTWPIGIHPSLYGTNYDLPVTHIDFFATFAEIMEYPLPGPEFCTYGFSTLQPGKRIPETAGRPMKKHGQTNSNYIMYLKTKLGQKPIPWVDLWEGNLDVCMRTTNGGWGIKEKEWCTFLTCDECRAAFDKSYPDDTNPEHVRLRNRQKWMCKDNKSRKAKCMENREFDKDKFWDSYGTEVGTNNYLMEHEFLGNVNVEQFITQEVQTGLAVGWDGCMAEDSVSFADVFKATKDGGVKNGHQTFAQTGDYMHGTKIMSGKLGDVSVRLGRYKLIRFNPPKDRRTGPSRQHLTKNTHHEGKYWWSKRDFKQSCDYDFDGNVMNPDCSIEPMCRPSESWGEASCMRDHYYQLWDLEKNFGEKTECTGNWNTRSSGSPNEDLNEGIGADDVDKKFDMGAEGTKKPEKGADESGYGSGIESTPTGEWLNDCCVLNYDEKPVPDECEVRMVAKSKPTHLQLIKYNGGKCVQNKFLHPKMKTWTQYLQFKKNHEAYYNKIAAKNSYTIADDFFYWPDEAEPERYNEANYATWGGYTCSKQRAAKPWHNNWMQKWHAVEVDGEYIQSSMGHQFCIPKGEDTEWKKSCKVKDHDGPLAEGWEVNDQWKNVHTDDQLDHWTGVVNEKNGDIKHSDFGSWHKLANCMKAVMILTEGIAYHPELREYNGGAHGWQTPADLDGTYSDNGEREGKKEDDKKMSGQRPGDSDYSRNWRMHLVNDIFADKTKAQIAAIAGNDCAKLHGEEKKICNLVNNFHSAGTRYNEDGKYKTSNIQLCEQYIGSDNPKAFDIKPNFDSDQSKIGYYDNNANDKILKVDTNGSIHIDGKKYTDDRPVRKIYDGKHKYFNPGY